MKKITIATLIVVMIMGFSATSFAGRGHGGQKGMSRGGHGGGHPLLTVKWEKIVEVADQVGITDDQLETLQALRSDYREATGDTKVDLKNRREDLREMMTTATEKDRAAAMKLVDEINDLQGKLMKNSIASTFEIKKILSEDQLNQLKELAKEKRKECQEERSERRQGKGRGRGNRS